MIKSLMEVIRNISESLYHDFFCAMASDIALIPAFGHDKNKGKAYVAQWKSFLSTGTTAAAVPYSWAQGPLTRSGLEGTYTELVLTPGRVRAARV